MSKIITADFDGKAMQFREDGWFNATVAAERFGKRVDHWLSNREAGQYITALSEMLNTRNSGELIHARKGRNGGAMTGSYAPINRGSLTAKQLRLLELLEAQDMLLIGSGPGYDERKRVLSTFAAEQCQRLALPANDVGRLSA